MDLIIITERRLNVNRYTFITLIGLEKTFGGVIWVLLTNSIKKKTRRDYLDRRIINVAIQGSREKDRDWRA